MIKNGSIFEDLKDVVGEGKLCPFFNLPVLCPLKPNGS